MGATAGREFNFVLTDVSILAHLERWALPEVILHETEPSLVSILAHLERWALRFPGLYENMNCYVSILAHLERWALLGNMG